MLLQDLMPSFFDELEKIAAEEGMDWKEFERSLRSPAFRAQALQDTDDPKLKQYIKNVGGVKSSKDLHAYVQSSTNPKKDYQVKQLPGGRYGCTCKDWQYNHSTKKTDCKHVKRYKQYLQGKVKESSMDLGMFRAFGDELQKIAARRGLKEVAKHLKAGDLGKAQALAQKPGVIKSSPQGSQIRNLGAGAEGVASLVAHPQHGVSVRKLYDPAGMSTPAMIARKEQVGRSVQSPHLPAFHGAAQAPGGAPMHFSEFVQGKSLGSAQGDTTAKMRDPRNPIHSSGTKGVPEHAAARQAAAGAHKAMRQAGFKGGGRDVRMANMVKTPEGKVKVIDYMPAHKGEFSGASESARLTGGARAAMVAKTPAAEGLFNPGSTNTPTPRLLASQLNAPGRPVRPSKAGPMAADRTPTMGSKTPAFNRHPGASSIKMPAGETL